MVVFCTADYFLFQLFWVGLNVAITAWILNIHHQDPKDCKWMGHMMRSLIFGCMARLVRHKSQLEYDNRSAGDSVGNGISSMTKEMKDMDQMNTTSGKNGSSMLESEVHKIRQFLEDRKNDRDVDEAMNEVEGAPLQEWKEAVIIIDKFFFRVYMIANILLAIIFVVVMITSVVVW